MTIVTDIIAAMDAAEMQPIGVHFCISAWNAFHARARSVEMLGDDIDSLDDIVAIRRLACFRTNDFPGFDLILDDVPSSGRPVRRKTVA